MVSFQAAATLLLFSPPCIWLLYRLCIRNSGTGGRSKPSVRSDGAVHRISIFPFCSLSNLDPAISDPSLLKKHSTLDSVHVKSTDYHYPEIRVFYSPHPHAAKLPALPLLVFIHGLGGSVAQFNPLLTSLSNAAPCLAVDLPGCGMSRFAPRYWDAYSTNSLVHLLIEIINRYRKEDQEIVFICHSMGCSLGALLASKASLYYSALGDHVHALIGICPPDKSISPEQVNQARWLLSIPGPIFDIWRAWDRRGGTESASVARFTGPNAEEQLKRLQVRFNTQSRTPVFRRMAYGALPNFTAGSDEYSRGAFVGSEIWSGIEVPVLLIAGTDDPVTPAAEAIRIATYLGHSGEPESHHVDLSQSPIPHQPLTTSSRPETPTHSHPPSKLVVFPTPASHALMYAPLTVRPVSNLIQHFLESFVTPKLALGWQLQHMTTEGKWDVKNLRKWQAVEPVSAPIAGVFRAMKTLREVDGLHTPLAFVERWSSASTQGAGMDGLGAIAAVVDISHDPPVYNPKGLEQNGILYTKCPSVSKLPPTLDEVRIFNDMVDHLRTQLAALENVTLSDKSSSKDTMALPPPLLIAVHCHYGFNRTGFFVVAYLIERMGWPLKDAMEEFARSRPPGIRHGHFIDELWGRYWDWTDERAIVNSNSGFGK